MRNILCFGNPLHGDDGFGQEVYRQLSALPCPPDLRLIDAGTPGPAALYWFQHCEEAVIVDATEPQGQPGRLSQPAALDFGVETVATGHGVGVGYLLQALATLPESMPRIRILVAEAAEISPFRPGLSPAVAAAANQAAALLSQLYFRE